MDLRTCSNPSSGNEVMSTPSIRTCPASGAMSPIKCLSKTVFPTPLEPSRTTISPEAISKVISSRTRSPAKLLQTPSTLIIGRTLIITEFVLGELGIKTVIRFCVDLVHEDLRALVLPDHSDLGIHQDLDVVHGKPPVPPVLNGFAVTDPLCLNDRVQIALQ